MFNRCQNLIATVLHTPQTLSKITEPPAKGVNISLHSSGSLIHKCQNYFPYIYHPLQVFSSSLLMKTSCLRLKLVELNFLVSFNTDDQSKTDIANAINVITYKHFFVSFISYKVQIEITIINTCISLTTDCSNNLLYFYIFITIHLEIVESICYFSLRNICK